MNDPPAAASMLGIEAVEWFAEGGENLTVRVTGRWRRRRPAWSAQPVLVVEAAGRRFRFPAMPEPPSLTGTGPGTWRISFAVPAALAPELAGRAWLAFGAVVVPLPAAVQPPGQGSTAPAPVAPAASESATPAAAEHPEAQFEPSPPSPELAAEEARRRAREAEDAAERLTGRVHDLERELASAKLEAERLSTTLSERERNRRAAEQRAHAAQAQCRDLDRQLAARGADADRVRETLGDLAAAEERIRELERELQGARRRVDEAEQLAAMATAARQRGTATRQRATEARQRAEPTPLSTTPAPITESGLGEADRLRREHELIVRRTQSRPRVPAEPPLAPPRLPPSRPVTAGDPLLAALRQELESRAAGEGALRARLLDVEGSLAARGLIERRTKVALAQLRQELDGLRVAFERERAARVVAERRAEALSRELTDSRHRARAAYDAITELRQGLQDRPVAPVSRAPSSKPAGHVVEPERLNDARLRLRQAIAPQERGAEVPTPSDAPGAIVVPDAERTPRTWLEPIWERLARTDPSLAGRLLVELLPAQGEAHPDDVAYDLVFEGGRGCAQVTCRDGVAAIRHGDAPRASREVDFQLFGDPAAIARLLIAGRLRRRFGRGVARIRGRRARLAALRSLVQIRLDLRGLHRLGIRFEPELALRLAALMIEPSWTARERFAVAYAASEGPASYIVVREGAPVEMTTAAPASRIATTISGPADAAALVLSGERTDAVTISGEEWPLALLRKWIKRAQSD